MSDDLCQAEPNEMLVVQFADGWRILAGAGRWGRFDDGVDAEQAARRLEAAANRSGQAVRILVQRSTGELRPLDED
jgi:hypothetical protein